MGRRRQLIAGQRVSLDIDPQLDEEGRGVARHAGLAVHVPGALPGERVTAEITHVGVHGKAFARVVSIEASSADRITPACARFGICGGCDLLHASPAVQGAYKRAQVTAAFAPLQADVDPTVASPTTAGYRALAKMVVGPDGTLGSYAPRSHDVVDMQGCAIHAPVIERVLDAIRGAIRSRPHDLRYVLVRAAVAEEKAIVTLVVRDATAGTPRALLPVLAAMPEVVRVGVHVNAGDGDAILGPGAHEILLDRGATAERLGEVDQDLDGAAFAQINPGAATELYRLASSAARPAGRTVLDLYSGSGGLALTFAQDGAAQVTGVERSAEGTAAAARSAERMGLTTATFIAGDVEAMLPSLPQTEVVVVNPPRRGLPPGVVEELARRAPLDLVYVSCNPKSAARDLAALGALAELRIARITPVDLFPQTRHVEAVIEARIEPRTGPSP